MAEPAAERMKPILEDQDAEVWLMMVESCVEKNAAIVAKERNILREIRFVGQYYAQCMPIF